MLIQVLAGRKFDPTLTIILILTLILILILSLALCKGANLRSEGSKPIILRKLMLGSRELRIDLKKLALDLKELILYEGASSRSNFFSNAV